MLALLLLCGILSCKKDIRSSTLSQATAPSLSLTQSLSGTGLERSCPSCVANFAAETETAATNGVLTLAGGVFTSAGTTVTTVPTTKETYAVGNVIVTVSHDAKNVYFTLERNNSTGGFGNLRFYSPAVVPVPTRGPGNTGFPTTVKKIQVISSRAFLPACSEVYFSFQVSGGGNPSVAGEVATTEALTYKLRDLCPVACTIKAGDYRTQTRGYWPNKNGQAFLGANPNLFPLTVGDGSNAQGFADAASVAAFLNLKASANGTPGVLPNGGTLAAQVLTLAINLKADAQVAEFGAANGRLGDLVVNIDAADLAVHPNWASLVSWNGKTVEEIFALAQNVLGGSSTAYSPSQMNAVVTAINENFDNGTLDTGFLGCGN